MSNKTVDNIPECCRRKELLQTNVLFYRNRIVCSGMLHIHWNEITDWFYKCTTHFWFFFPKKCNVFRVKHFCCADLFQSEFSDGIEQICTNSSNQTSIHLYIVSLETSTLKWCYSNIFCHALEYFSSGCSNWKLSFFPSRMGSLMIFFRQAFISCMFASISMRFFKVCKLSFS